MSEYKLKKPRGYDVSEITKVTFGTQEVDCANLRKSAILVQTSVMVASNGEWHEIEIADLGLDSVHMPTFKHHIESNGLKLSDLGLAPEVKRYELTHDDFMELERQFPKYTYTQIAKLHKWHLDRKSNLTGMYHLRQELTHISQHYLDINAYMQKSDADRMVIINQKHEPIDAPTQEAEETYSDVVDEQQQQQHVIKVDVVEKDPAQETEGVSITMFENLSPAKITELSALRAEQEKIAKENPVITITNATTYKEAKKVKAILLSASTKIDGKTGVFANAKRFINDFKSKFDKEGEEIAKITRVPHDQQNKLITDWDNRIQLQIQNRTKLLTSVPFVYNSENGNYTIGTLVVTQKDIENDTDAEFNAWVEKGRVIKTAMDSLQSEQSKIIEEQAKQIAEMKAMLEKLLPKKDTEPIRTHIDAVKEGEFSGSVSFVAGNVKEKIETISETPFEPIDKPEHMADFYAQGNAEVKTEQKAYQLPSPENKLLNSFDLAHAEVLEESGFLLKREGYIQALADVSVEIRKILYEIDPALKKGAELEKMMKSWQ